MIDARDFLDAVSGYANKPQTSADKPIRLGTIDSGYVGGGLAKVTFDGDSVMSQKGYAFASSYNPVPGQRVFLLPIGTTYLIGGRVNSSSGIGANYVAYITQTNIASGQYWGPGTFSADSSSTDATLVSNPVADTIQFRDAGIYAVSAAIRFNAAMVAGGSPLPFISLEKPSAGATDIAYAKGPVQAGDTQGTASNPNIPVVAGQQIKIVTFQNTGAVRTGYWRINVTRIA